jgi:hypothetical protein
MFLQHRGARNRRSLCSRGLSRRRRRCCQEEQVKPNNENHQEMCGRAVTSGGQTFNLQGPRAHYPVTRLIVVHKQLSRNRADPDTDNVILLLPSTYQALKPVPTSYSTSTWSPLHLCAPRNFFYLKDATSCVFNEVLYNIYQFLPIAKH